MNNCGLNVECLDCPSLVTCDMYCEYGWEKDRYTGCDICQCKDPCRVRVCSSLANLNILTKLQFIRIETELVYIGRRRTTSFSENDTRVNGNCKYNASNTSNDRGNWNTKSVSLFWSCKDVAMVCHCSQFIVSLISAVIRYCTASRTSAFVSVSLRIIYVAFLFYSLSFVFLLSFFVKA